MKRESDSDLKPAGGAYNGWHRAAGAPSMPEVHASIPIALNAGFWRRLWAFTGPGLMVAVGYMDPGNWATDLAGGAQFGYTLLSVVLLSNLAAMLLQHLALKTLELLMFS